MTRSSHSFRFRRCSSGRPLGRNADPSCTPEL